jgi:hypothetical protein
MSTGLLSQLGVAEESAYGTFVEPDRFFEFDSESLSRAQTYLTSTGLKAGRRIPSIDRHRGTTRSAGGDITMKVPTRNFGVLLDMLHGNAITPVQQAATTAYLQTHNIGTTAPDSKSRTIQVAKPQVDGTVKPFSYLGCKITQATFSIDTGGELMVTFSVDAQDEDTSEALATASYASDTTSYLFTEAATVTIGSSTALVRSFNLTIPIPQATDRYGLGTSPLKSQPLNNDYIRPTMSITAEYLDDTLYGHFVDDDEIAVAVLFEGNTIATTYEDSIGFSAAGVKVTGATPPVNGPGLLQIDAPLEIYDTGSGSPLAITYISTETAI